MGYPNQEMMGMGMPMGAGGPGMMVGSSMAPGGGGGQQMFGGQMDNSMALSATGGSMSGGGGGGGGGGGEEGGFTRGKFQNLPLHVQEEKMTRAKAQDDVKAELAKQIEERKRLKGLEKLKIEEEDAKFNAKMQEQQKQLAVRRRRVSCHVT